MKPYPPIVDLLPHKPPMVLLDAVLSTTTTGATVKVNIRPGIPFYVAGYGVAAHVGLEYMAQACGVYAGLQSLEQNEPVKMGFLLGTRNFQAITDWFADGAELIVDVNEVLRQDSLGVFDCSITAGGTVLAHSQLTVYQSDAAVPAMAN